MKISVLTSSKEHPITPILYDWKKETELSGHVTEVVFDKASLTNGDILFLVSCSEILTQVDRKKFSATLVIHASDLPADRGWSPHIWNIINGKNEITVSLLEADDKVDAGAIIKKVKFHLNGDELLDEINTQLFKIETELMTYAIGNAEHLERSPQTGEIGAYRPKRTPADSKLDVDLSIADQFNLMRTVDNTRYPAFFFYAGHKYVLKIEKANDD